MRAGKRNIHSAGCRLMEEQRHRAALLEQEERIREREREREQRERESERPNREQYQGNAPHHSNAGSIPIHQPVANRFPGTIHSPGGLLANHGASASSIPLGAPSGPGGGPVGPIHGESNRQMPHGGQNGAAPSQHQMFAPVPHGSMPPNGSISASSGSAAVFGPPLQPEGGRGPGQPMPFGASMATGHAMAPAPGGMNQGQQPILNDALSYLDQVKVQFSEQPDVYNRFLDIMKDFKSQTIDTPGVINRVSELFAGHPNLIQGFNTFLPPGYRIECGLENNPNSIRVTTPSGTTLHSIGPGRSVNVESGPAPSSAPSQRFVEQQRPANWQGPVQHSIESPEVRFSTPAQSGHGAIPHGSGQSAPFDNNSPVQQRGQPPAQNSSATSHPPIARNAHTPTPAAAQALNGNSAQAQANLEKRGPVEFNHAISYVNKIKNRFQDKPEIYKQFLEILQTYQREQKPIQDVYAQVTTLFNAAPDLLEDFKQFLPESAAQTRGAAQRPDEFNAMAAAAQTPQLAHTARDGPKGPPVGNFAPPPSASKETKKRARPDKQPGPAMSLTEPPTSNMRGAPSSAANKRLKTSHSKPGAADSVLVEPTLTPVMPEPLAPAPPAVSASDEIGFFDKVKKHINNKTAFSEFLKLCNMFTQELIDKDLFISRACQFIGGHTELYNWLKEFVTYSGEDIAIENRPEPPTGRVSLSNCRGYGPSYRLLPKRERLKPCSGRDDLCNSVLNDEWASHPTWASEDSGFVAHRKNAFEEGLHRIEEERHDYDFYIELNQKCIQLLEPIAQQMLTLPPQERANFRMPTGLGGHSQSIYKRVLKKVYGPEHGPLAVNDMFSNPFSVVPVVLARLKQKDEEWRFSQREWERVWQQQTETLYLKSLDHMGLSIKTNDKRNLSAKHLVDLIKTKHEEQKRSRAAKNKVPRYQFLWSFDDKDVILDLLRFMIMYAMNSGQHGATEKERILDFFETFVPQFFDLPEDKVQDRLANIDRDSGDEDAEELPPAELTNGRSGRRNGRKSDLLRGVLDPGRNGSKSRNHKEGSAASGSKETTPDVVSGNEEEMPDAPEDSSVPEVGPNDRWLATAPVPTVHGGSSLLDECGDLKADSPFQRPWYNFFCNQTIYVFFSVLQTLYKRLKSVKDNKEGVIKEIKREQMEKPAKVLGLVAEDLKFFENLSEDQFWGRTVELVEEFINGDIDENRYQDVLRHYYLSNGWTLYTIQDLLKTLCRLALVCNNNDNKEKTPDLIKQYMNSRHQEETSYQTEINHRKFAEKCIKDGEMFVVTWFPEKEEATVRWLRKEDTTFHVDEMELREHWQYYISSWTRTDPTEGVPRSHMQKVVLTRNLPSGDADSDSDFQPKAISYSEGLVLKICLNTYKISYDKGTSNYFIYNIAGGSSEDRALHEKRLLVARETRNQKFKEKMAMNSPWMKDLSQEEVQQAKEAFEKWKTEGIPPQKEDDDDLLADVPRRRE
ncbi:Paired amphipathic helix protein pst1 [Cytospora mali]|uniref:Paired amphipathic helix protein pst1 n=1 Tax=Cytospora mali TaxID=578113 RepID=A0A194W468_CYTMA|nr:Paired amphipathic helix protein pst1 [Valsa mali]